jgi:hypothetical protein
MSRTFIDLCVQGEALLDDIDEFVDMWHNSADDGGLSDFLGMTLEEYSLWISQPDILPYVITARRIGKPISEIVADVNLPMAARSDNPSKAKKLMQWLESQGKV